MQALREIGDTELRWIKPSWRKLQFELRAGEAVVATLVWTGGGRAVGQWDAGQYRLSREGWFRPRVVVRGASAAADEPVATFAYRGGTLTFPDGRAFVWKRPRRWTNERIWVDGAGTELLRFRRSRGQAAVALSAAAAERPELPLLLLLGQYLLVLEAQDAAVAATAAVVPVIASS